MNLSGFYCFPNKNEKLSLINLGQALFGEFTEIVVYLTVHTVQNPDRFMLVNKADSARIPGDIQKERKKQGQ